MATSQFIFDEVFTSIEGQFTSFLHGIFSSRGSGSFSSKADTSLEERTEQTKVLLLLSSEKAKAEFDETTELEILLFLVPSETSRGTTERSGESSIEAEAEVLFFLTGFAKSINSKRSQLFEKWSSNLHDVTEVLEILLVLSSGTSHEATKERRQETEEEVLLFLVPSETSRGTTERCGETSIEAEAEVLLGSPANTSSATHLET